MTGTPMQCAIYLDDYIYMQRPTNAVAQDSESEFLINRMIFLMIGLVALPDSSRGFPGVDTG